MDILFSKKEKEMNPKLLFRKLAESVNRSNALIEVCLSFLVIRATIFHFSTLIIENFNVGLTESPGFSLYVSASLPA